MFIEEDKISQKLNYLTLLKLLKPFFLRRKWSFALVIIALIGLVVMGRLGPQIFGWALDQGIHQRKLDLLKQLVIGYAAVEAFRLILHFAHGYLFQKLGNTVLYDVRLHMLRHVQSLPMTYFDKNPSGRVVTRLTSDVAAVGEIFTEGLFTVFISIFEVTAIVIAMMLISPKLALATLASLPIMLFAAFTISHKIQDVMRESRKTMAQLNAFVTERLSAIKLIQAMNFSAPCETRYGNDSRYYYEQQMRSVRLYVALWPIVNLFYAVTLGVAFYAVAYWDLGLQIGSMVAFTMHAQDIFPPLRNILERYQQFQNSLTGAERVHKVSLESVEYSPAEPVNISTLGPKLSVQFDNVTFRYAESLPTVLKTLSFDVPAGSSCAIVGPTGSGKSTTISLLQKFYANFEGDIKINGTDIRNFDPEQLRRYVQAVTQDHFIFRGTLRDNLCLFDSTFDDERLLQAIDSIGANNLLKRLGGLQGELQERGANLSMGERQLLALARVLVFNPPVLILDEATANMDSVSESIVQKAIQKAMQNRTSIVIAHRLSTIVNCNQIVFIENGELKERGTHRELLARKGAYSQYYALL